MALGATSNCNLAYLASASLLGSLKITSRHLNTSSAVEVNNMNSKMGPGARSFYITAQAEPTLLVDGLV